MGWLDWGGGRVAAAVGVCPMSGGSPVVQAARRASDRERRARRAALQAASQRFFVRSRSQAAARPRTGGTLHGGQRNRGGGAPGEPWRRLLLPPNLSPACRR